MQIPKGTVIAVVDGEAFHLFRNGGDESNLQLSAMPEPDVDSNNRSAGARHQSSSANPDDGQQDEDTFVAGVAEKLNKQVLNGKIESLVVIAAPRSLGELRKHYHKSLSAVLVGEINKDLTGHSLQEIEKAIQAQ